MNTQTHYLFNEVSNELHEFKTTDKNATVRRLSVKDSYINTFDDRCVLNRHYDIDSARTLYKSLLSQKFKKCFVRGSMIHTIVG